MSYDCLKQYFFENKVLFASNGDFDDDVSPLKMSIETYKEIVPENGLCVIDSERGKYYGYSAFKKILEYAISKSYDYVIYIDADCFIIDKEKIYLLFKSFADYGKDMFSGVSDGGVICHRNVNRYAINPFFSFYNVKLIKERFFNGGELVFPEITEIKVSKRSEDSVNSTISLYSDYRLKNGIIPPHAEKISKSSFEYQHYFTPNQRPYTFKDLDFKSEPYYRIFLAAHNGVDSIKYMFGKDYIGKCDDTGITTAIMFDNEFKDDGMVCLHTWFSRCYNRTSKNGFEKLMTDRILSVWNFCMENRK